MTMSVRTDHTRARARSIPPSPPAAAPRHVPAPLTDKPPPRDQLIERAIGTAHLWTDTEDIDTARAQGIDLGLRMAERLSPKVIRQQGKRMGTLRSVVRDETGRITGAVDEKVELEP